MRDDLLLSSGTKMELNKYSLSMCSRDKLESFTGKEFKLH